MSSAAYGPDTGTVIVAHGDDETLWAAGLIMRTGWNVICCTTPIRDPIRATQFLAACEVLGAKGEIFDRAEDEHTFLDLTCIYGHGLIASHNERGEYGHLHHKQVNAAFQPEITFGYKARGEFRLVLTPEERVRKRQALKCYTEKWKDLLDTFDVFEVETYDASGPAGREVLAAICGAV